MATSKTSRRKAVSSDSAAEPAAPALPLPEFTEPPEPSVVKPRAPRSRKAAALAVPEVSVEVIAEVAEVAKAKAQKPARPARAGKSASPRAAKPAVADAATADEVAASQPPAMNDEPVVASKPAKRASAKKTPPSSKRARTSSAAAADGIGSAVPVPVELTDQETSAESIETPQALKKAAAAKARKTPANRKAQGDTPVSTQAESQAASVTAAKPAPRKRPARKSVADEVTNPAVADAEVALPALTTADEPDVVAPEMSDEEMQVDVLPAEAPLEEAYLVPPPAPLLPYSEVLLVDGLERQLQWVVGEGAPEALLDAAADLFGDEACISAEQAQGLPELLNLASELGHELRVGDAVWSQLAHGADTAARVQRLESLYPEGPDSAELQALLRQALPAYQWESALFAVCAGRALLADDLGQSQRSPALAAWALWHGALGLRSGLVVAPVARHALWRQQAERLLGGWPEGLRLLDTDAAPPADTSGLDVLVLDAAQLLSHAQIERWRGVPVAQLLLLSDRELLGESLLAPLVAWLDVARRGPLARLQALGEVPNKRMQREALQTLMLSRRKRDLAAQLPLCQDHDLWLPPVSQADQLDEAALAHCRAALQRWQALGFLSAAEQMPLWRALSSLRQAAVSDAACAIKAEALPGLLSDLLLQGARKVVVYAQQDGTLRQLYQGLVDGGWAVANVRRHQSAEVRQLELQAWATPDEEGGCAVLLATDAACQGLDLAQDGVAVVHADLPWNPALLQARVLRVAGAQRAIPCWRLLMPGSFDAAVLAAHQGVDGMPSACLDHELASVAIVTSERLPTLMAALARAMAA